MAQGHKLFKVVPQQTDLVWESPFALNISRVNLFGVPIPLWPSLALVFARDSEGTRGGDPFDRDLKFWNIVNHPGTTAGLFEEHELKPAFFPCSSTCTMTGHWGMQQQLLQLDLG